MGTVAPLSIPNRQAGMSLVEVLVGLALFGILASGMSRLFADSFRASAKVTNDIDRDAIKAMLVRSVSCKKTLPTGSCEAGTLLELIQVTKKGTERTLVESTGRRFGKIAVRAACDSEGEGIVLRSVRLKPGASIANPAETDYLPDPLTGKTVTFESDSSLLLPIGVYACSYPSRPVITCNTTQHPLQYVYNPSSQVWTRSSQELNYRLPAKAFYHSFTKDECGGSLPDARYVCAYSSQEVCGSDESWTIAQPTESKGPEVSAWWLGACDPDGAGFNRPDIGVVCLQRDANGL